PGSQIDAVYLCRAPVDFRKSIGGLSALVEQELGLNPFGTALYVFVNRQRDKIKALYWHRNGFCLWYKRLEREKCNDPALSAQFKRLMQMSQPGFSCPVLGVGAGSCKSRSSRRSRG